MITPRHAAEACLACGHETLVREGEERRCAECGHAWPAEAAVVRTRGMAGPTDRRRRTWRAQVLVAILVAALLFRVELILGTTVGVMLVLVAIVLPGWRPRSAPEGLVVSPERIEAWSGGRRHRTIELGDLTSFRVSPRLGRRPVLLLGHPRGRGFDRAELLTDAATAERIHAMLHRRLPERLPWADR